MWRQLILFHLESLFSAKRQVFFIFNITLNIKGRKFNARSTLHRKYQVICRKQVRLNLINCKHMCGLKPSHKLF